MKLLKRKPIVASQRIIAADEDMLEDELDDNLLEEDDGLEDSVDDLADQIEDLQDVFDGIEEDDPNIEIDNNIEGRYIAECDRCKGIFISAIPESDVYMDHIHGTCPLCEHETDQYLNWVVRNAER